MVLDNENCESDNTDVERTKMSKDLTMKDIKKRQDFLFSVLSLCTLTAINVVNSGADIVEPFAAATGCALAVPVEMIPNDPSDTIDFAFALGVYTNAPGVGNRPATFHEFPELEKWVEKRGK